MNLLDAHGEAIAEFGALVERVTPEQWTAATPCTDWNVRALVNHLTSEQLWVPDILAGKTIDEVGTKYAGDVLGTDPKATWKAAATAARAAWCEPGALDRYVHLSFGSTPAMVYLSQMVTDLVVHGWDLAMGIDDELQVSDELVAQVTADVAGSQEELLASGLFAEPVPLPADAAPLDRLVAMLGRDPVRG